jgi:hypothetical protein
LHPNARVVDATVLRGQGYPSSTKVIGQNSLTFRTRPGHNNAPQLLPGESEDSVGIPNYIEAKEGYVDISVTWRDLPYQVKVRNTVFGNESEDANAEVNSPNGCELMRYCIFKPHPKGNNTTIAGGSMYFADDDGQLIPAAGNPAQPLAVIEAQPFITPAATYSITLKMVPRIPIAAELLRGFVNQADNFSLPANIFPGPKPAVGTLLYTGYELSDMYYTVSGQPVWDVTYSIGYRPSGQGPYRGWNSAFCTKRRDFRRAVFGELRTSPPRIVTTYNNVVVLPVTSDTAATQVDRATERDANIYDFAELINLFRFEGPSAISPS